MNELTSCGCMIADVEEALVHEARIDMMPLIQDFVALDENETYVIALNFIVVHKGEEIGVGSNISDDQIYSAVNVCNQIYGKESGSNFDAENAKTPFRFEIANKDDEGNFSTGITRVDASQLSSKYIDEGIYHSKTGKGENELMVKRWSKMDKQRVCNVWIVSEIGGNNAGGGIQGFAYFPTSSDVDGIVQLYNATGTVGNRKSYTSLSITLPHEIGHWLALFHTFQGNSCNEANCEWSGDRVCDTPPTIQNSNANNPACGGTQQIWNILDYTSEKVKKGITQGQSDRAVAALLNSRASILTSDALDNISLIDVTATIEMVVPDYVGSGTEVCLRVKVTNTSTNPINRIKFQYTIDGEVAVDTWHGAIAPLGVNCEHTIGLNKFILSESTTIDVSVLEMNGNPSELSDSKTIVVPDNPPCRIEILSDVLQGQISWDITRKSDMKIVYQNEPYKNFAPNEDLSEDVYLPDGEFILTFIDAQVGFQTNDAYLRFVDFNGNVLMNETGDNADAQITFVIGKKDGDLNGDGVVNIIDFSLMNQAFGSSEGDDNYNPDADLNKDGGVNILDFSILNQKFIEDQQ